MKTHLSRRKLLRMAAAASTLPLQASLAWGQMPHGNAGRQASADFEADLELRLSARRDRVRLREPGPATEIWRYDGQVLQGDPEALGFLDGAGYLPVIHVRRGQRLRIRFRNLLPEPSIVHWHGLHMPQAMDGHPMYAIGTGEEFVYEFTVETRAGTYWFHPHPHERTAVQVYRGLTGLILVSDEEEQALGLPDGDLDLPLVLQDRRLDARNQLVHLGSQRRAWMQGFSGDLLTVNGALAYQRSLPRTAVRLRLFNGANATTFRLRWHDGTPMRVIATDGGLLEQAVERQVLTLAVAERLELWLDLSA
jgi:FtsP/CotA-like multicopper oxidase with cupredoxin domain